MNQRMSKNSKKNNNLNFVSLNTGGLTARHSPNTAPDVQVPQKATGDIKPEFIPAIAKASPNFKPLDPVKTELTDEEKKKAIAENVKLVDDSTKTK